MKPEFYLNVEIPYHAVKKNNRPIVGRGLKKWIGKSDRLRSAENLLTAILRNRFIGLGLKDPIEGDLHCVFVFHCDNYFTEKGERSKMMADLSNLIELPADCLQQAGVIKNDSDICLLDGTRRMPSKTNRLEVFVYKLTNSVYQRQVESYYGSTAV